MDVSPIQKLAIAANQTTPAAQPVRRVPAVAPAAQAAAASTDQQATGHSAGSEAAAHVVVAWHAASLGYVTRVVDQHTGNVVYESPPERILDMVAEVIERLEGENR